MDEMEAQNKRELDEMDAKIQKKKDELERKTKFREELWKVEKEPERTTMTMGLMELVGKVQDVYTEAKE